MSETPLPTRLRQILGRKLKSDADFDPTAINPPAVQRCRHQFLLALRSAADGGFDFLSLHSADSSASSHGGFELDEV